MGDRFGFRDEASHDDGSLLDKTYRRYRRARKVARKGLKAIDFESIQAESSVRGELYRRYRKARKAVREAIRELAPTEPTPETAYDPELDYATWVEAYDNVGPEAASALSLRASILVHKPVFTIWVASADASAVDATLESLRRQAYPHWQLLVDSTVSTDSSRKRISDAVAADPRVRTVDARVSDDEPRAKTFLRHTEGDFIGWCDAGDEFPPHALFFVAEELNKYPSAWLVYTDEDRLTVDGRRTSPWFKPDFGYETFLSMDLLADGAWIRRGAIESVGGIRSESGASAIRDVVLRAIEQNGSTDIRHVPRVLVHRRLEGERFGFVGEEAADVVRIVGEHFARTGVAASLEHDGSRYRLRYERPDPPPFVSLIIPTWNRVELLRACVSSILTKTSYEAYEILVVDNGSDDTAAISYLHMLRNHPRVRVIRDELPFNFSRLNNEAAREARGEILGLINNDIEVISPGWLDEMVRFVARPEIGAVGAKLLYPNNTIQHAGVTIGMYEIAGHTYCGMSQAESLVHREVGTIRNVSCVTAACLLVRKDLFFEIGGLNEVALPVAFNDVDLCLRIRERQLRIVWTPYAELWHHESVSRGPEDTPEKRSRIAREIDYMFRRWSDRLKRDPAYTPNRTLSNLDARLAHPPRVPPLRDVR